jgi:hypothetical protein
MSTDGLIERLRSTSEKCRHFAATASDPEVAESLLELASEMDTAISAVAENVDANEERAA